MENGVTSEEYLSGKDWGRNYLINSAPSITYNDLASEYNYASFEELKTHTEKDLSSINGNEHLPVVTSGTTLYVNLPSPIEGTSASATNFFNTQKAISITNIPWLSQKFAISDYFFCQPSFIAIKSRKSKGHCLILSNS